MTGLFTGYYEASARGSRVRTGRYDVPLYRRPGDLVSADLGSFSDEFRGRTIAGRVEGNHFVPYDDRHAIADGALAGRGLELLWVDDPVDAFFLEIQGSGRIAMTDGSVVRVGFAAKNGRPYTAIGRVLVDMGAMPKDQVSMQSIRAWLEAHPDKAREVMEQNRAYVFFRELTGDGPVGAEGVALTPGHSLAVDRRYLPLGVPLYLAADDADGTLAPVRALTVSQDTGGAIRGAVRGDLFLGWGAEAAARAGRMKLNGRYWMLLPRAPRRAPRLLTAMARGDDSSKDRRNDDAALWAHVTRTVSPLKRRRAQPKPDAPKPEPEKPVRPAKRPRPVARVPVRAAGGCPRACRRCRARPRPPHRDPAPSRQACRGRPHRSPRHDTRPGRGRPCAVPRSGAIARQALRAGDHGQRIAGREHRRRNGRRDPRRAAALAEWSGIASDRGRLRPGPARGRRRRRVLRVSQTRAGAVTPFGRKLRELRAQRGITLKQMAADLQLSPAYLSALEHGKRGRPSPVLVFQICQYFHRIWEDAEELEQLARLSHPRVTVDTSGLEPEATELANLLAEKIRGLTRAEVRRLLAVLKGQADSSCNSSLPALVRAIHVFRSGGSWMPRTNAGHDDVGCSRRPTG